MIEDDTKPMSTVSTIDEIEVKTKRAKNRGRGDASASIGDARAAVTLEPPKQHTEATNQ